MYWIEVKGSVREKDHSSTKVKNVRNFPKESRDNQTYTNGELENLNC
jgi:hypothetical protein